MKKLNKKEISFIQGVCENNLIQGYWLFSYYSQSNFDNVKKYIEKKEEIDNKLSELDYLEHRISSNLTRDKKKIKKLFELQRAELINKLDKDWNEKKLLSLWIELWFEKRLILQLKRPDTLWNKGDYTWNDEVKDKFYETNLLFVKFNDRDEYEKFDFWLYDSDAKIKYKEWFEKNEKYFTIIKI